MDILVVVVVRSWRPLWCVKNRDRITPDPRGPDACFCRDVDVLCVVEKGQRSETLGRQGGTWRMPQQRT